MTLECFSIKNQDQVASLRAGDIIRKTRTIVVVGVVAYDNTHFLKDGYDLVDESIITVLSRAPQQKIGRYVSESGTERYFNGENWVVVKVGNTKEPLGNIHPANYYKQETIDSWTLQ